MRLILFDVDGTLVDSQNTIVEAQRLAFAAHGLEPPSRAASLSVVGLSLMEAFTILAGPDGPVAALAESYRQAWHAIRSGPGIADPLFPGADETLKHLRDAGLLIGLATGKSRRGIAHIIAEYQWAGLFDTVQTADDAPSKPAPGMILNALRETGADASETIMVGDTTFDVLMGRAAGVTPIAVAWGYHPEADLLGAGASRLVRTFGALTALLDSGSLHAA